MRNPNNVFFTVGFLIWALGGWVISFLCFSPVTMPETIELNRELLLVWGSVMLKVVAVWGLIGGVLGVIIHQLFINRSEYEHRTFLLPGFDGPGLTLAMRNAMIQGTFLGLVFAFFASFFLLPLLANNLIVVVGPIRILFSLLVVIFTTPSILNFSLRFSVKQNTRRY
jgi:hypothetical protein